MPSRCTTEGITSGSYFKKISASPKVAPPIGRFTSCPHVDTAVRQKKEGVQGNSFPWPAKIFPQFFSIFQNTITGAFSTPLMLLRRA